MTAAVATATRTGELQLKLLLDNHSTQVGAEQFFLNHRLPFKNAHPARKAVARNLNKRSPRATAAS